MFIGQCQRRTELLDLAQCVCTELEMKQSELVIQTLWIFLCALTKCPSGFCGAFTQGKERRPRRDSYILLVYKRHPFFNKHTMKSSWDKWVIFYYERIMSCDNLFIAHLSFVQFIQSTLFFLFVFLGPATGEKGGAVRPECFNPQILSIVHLQNNSKTK